MDLSLFFPAAGGKAVLFCRADASIYYGVYYGGSQVLSESEGNLIL
jgi:hypothetical protein